MTEQEFRSQFLPVLEGRIKRAVTRPRGSSEFDKQVAKEANRQIWEILGSFPCEDACEAVRRLSTEDPGMSPAKALSVLSQRLRGDRREIRDPSAWTWQDEINLGHLLHDRPGMSATELARIHIGKNPSSWERKQALDYIQRVHIEPTRERMIERGCTPEEAKAKIADANW